MAKKSEQVVAKLLNNLKNLSQEDQLKALVALSRQQHKIEKRELFDPDVPYSTPTAAQQEILNDFGKVQQQWLVCGNRSGKTMTVSRICAWVLEETHPTWKRPERWGTKPLLIVFVAKSSKIAETEIWDGKIKRFLEPGSYKEVRSGMILQKVVMNNGNTLIFQSMENINLARERVQAYTAHLALIDEMPSSDKLIEELITRIVTTGGYFLAAFTPLLLNQKIRKRVDNAAMPHAKHYRLKMFDNPALTDQDKENYLQANAHLSAAELNARLNGDWISPENAVYFWDADKMLLPLPGHYSPLWRHVESIDPASNTTGLSVFAEDPQTGNWYMVKAWYLTIAEPNALVQKVIELTAPYNIVKRVIDSGYSAWFVPLAKLYGRTYSFPYNKTDGRKMDLIKQLQFALGGRLFVADTQDTQLFVDEVTTCYWSDTDNPKIVKSSRFHLLDTAQYFVDCMPKYETAPPPQNWWTSMRMEQEKEMNGETNEKKQGVTIERMAVRRKGLGKWKR